MTDKLKDYRKKRDFSLTREPKGRVKRSSKALKFSVQHHIARADHYDLRLEYGGVALSWALPKGPSYRTSDKRLAARVEDHPVDYMDFEGVIPKGQYGGGTVMLWDEGTWEPRLDPKKGLEEGSLKFTLFGKRLMGNWALVRMKAEGSSEPWLLIKEKDGLEKRAAGISRFTRGVRSGKTMKEIADAGAVNPFHAADVALAQLSEELPAGKGWLFELKYDGHRVLAFSEKGKTALKTRNGADCTRNFPPAAEGTTELLKGRAAVLDGEMIVVGKNGLSDFGALQSYAKRGGGDDLAYVVFDLLALDGEDLRGLPLAERKKRLKSLMKDPPAVLRYSEHAEKLSPSQLAVLKERGCEGIVAKRADSPYTAGKSGDWVKIKFRNSREFVVGGYLRSENGGVRALLVGFYEGKRLAYAGKVGTGFSARERAGLAEKLNKLKRESSPFGATPKGAEKNAVWVKPSLVAQVEFAETTAAGLLRQASFKGLRRDKQAEEVDGERPRAARIPKKPAADGKDAVLVGGVAITRPEKVMFPRPKITKEDLARYYAAVAPRMFPYLKERRLSLVCCPAGIEGERFFRKHLDGEFAGVETAENGDGKEDFFVKSRKGIVSLAQYNAVEFHIRGAKTGKEPDMMVFDLDPDEGLPVAKVRKGARLLEETLRELGLISFLKTSGGKGYHIVVPFRSCGSERDFYEFSKRVAELAEREYPAFFTANMSKKERTGRIFLDWQRNGAGATSAAPYSVRAREGAPVSAPIFWEELGKIAPNGIDLSAALKRLELPDPWADFFRVKAAQRLKFTRLP